MKWRGQEPITQEFLKTESRSVRIVANFITAYCSYLLAQLAMQLVVLSWLRRTGELGKCWWMLVDSSRSISNRTTVKRRRVGNRTGLSSLQWSWPGETEGGQFDEWEDGSDMTCCGSNQNFDAEVGEEREGGQASLDIISSASVRHQRSSPEAWAIFYTSLLRAQSGLTGWAKLGSMLTSVAISTTQYIKVFDIMSKLFCILT